MGRTLRQAGWYHDAWPHLRRLGLVASPDWHASFYADALARARPPVLISGAADETMLAHVLRAGIAPDGVTVVDLAETPLAACRRLAPAVRTVRGDVRALDEPGGYGIVVSDAFLPRFPPEERPGVVAVWRRLLRPGGAAITTVRIGGAGADRLPPPPEMRAERLRRATLARAAGPDAERIGALAYEFGLRQRRHAVASVDEVLDLFEAAGFSTISAAEVKVRGTAFLWLVASPGIPDPGAN